MKFENKIEKDKKDYKASNIGACHYFSSSRFNSSWNLRAILSVCCFCQLDMFRWTSRSSLSFSRNSRWVERSTLPPPPLDDDDLSEDLTSPCLPETFQFSISCICSCRRQLTPHGEKRGQQQKGQMSRSDVGQRSSSYVGQSWKCQWWWMLTVKKIK